ncbi:hypothetical protein AKJ16_DCAP00694 [Drosera capensis]
MGENDESGSEEPSSVPSAANQQDDVPTEITEVLPNELQQRSRDLVLEIDSRTHESLVEDGVNMSTTPTRASTPRRVNFSPAPSPFREEAQSSPSPSLPKEKTSFKNLVPKFSFKLRKASSDIEKGVSTSLGSSSSGIRERSSMARTFSITKFFTPKIDRAESLPTTLTSHSNPESMHEGSKTAVQGSIPRSRSVPMFDKDGKLIDPVGGIFRVIPSTPRAKVGVSKKAASPIASDEDEDDGEDIPEEEAVCRICFIELGEGSDTLKMECSCKGELALAHQDCAVKWFSIKGNKICDVCKQDVKNLPVTLLRIQNHEARPAQGNIARQIHFRYRVWQDIPVLVTVSMLGYFCFLEQLLVSRMGSGAIAISLPFSLILGLLASMTSSTIASSAGSLNNRDCHIHWVWNHLVWPCHLSGAVQVENSSVDTAESANHQTSHTTT